ncbi:MAG: hypothetical protein ACQETH_06375 [Candidatus Rifleibacteriota bacterium]
MAGPVNNNPYLQQVLFQNLSSANVQPDQLKNSSNLISSAYSAKAGIATISANGAKINNVSQAIRQSGDAQAYEGFQKAVTQASSGDNPLNLIRFSTSADYLAKNDAQSLEQAFSSMADSLSATEDNSNFISAFNSAFTSTIEQSGTGGAQLFSEGINAVKEGDYTSSSVSQSQNLQKYFSLVNQINAGSESSEEANSYLKDLVRGIHVGDSGDGIWEFFNDFTGPDPDKIG